MHSHEDPTLSDLTHTAPLILIGLFQRAARAALTGNFCEAEALARRLLPLCERFGQQYPLLRRVTNGFLQDLFDPILRMTPDILLWRRSAAKVAGQPWPGEALRAAVAAISADERAAWREQESGSAAQRLAQALALAAEARLDEAAEVGHTVREQAYREDDFPLWFDAQIRFLATLFEGFPAGHPARRAWETGPGGRSWSPWPRRVIRQRLSEHFPEIYRQILGQRQ